MPDKDLGILTGAAGIGAVLNAYLIFYMRKYFTDMQMTTISIYLAGIVMFLFVVFSSLSLYFFLMLVFGFSWSLSVSVFNGILQSEFPKEIRSRLIGIYCVFFASAQAVGGFVAGKFIQLAGLNETLFYLAILTFLVGTCYVFFSWNNIDFTEVVNVGKNNNA
jgi:predicted MFS family arabinose efflux permease